MFISALLTMKYRFSGVEKGLTMKRYFLDVLNQRCIGFHAF